MDLVKDEMELEIINIISTISEIDKNRITIDADLRDDLGIDSMMGLEIMYAVEKKFSVHLREDDLPKMRSVIMIRDLMQERKKK